MWQKQHGKNTPTHCVMVRGLYQPWFQCEQEGIVWGEALRRKSCDAWGENNAENILLLSFQTAL